MNKPNQDLCRPNTGGRADGEDCASATVAATPAASGDALPFPARDWSKPAEQQGLFKKFRVQRTDGSDSRGCKHDGCRYFVIDLTHDQHAPAAMRAYAAACRATHPQLADDIEREFATAPAPAAPAAGMREAFEAWCPYKGAPDPWRVWQDAWAAALADSEQASVADYEEVLAGQRRLVRELDVLLNGEEGAAKQASLADIVAQVRREGIRVAAPDSAQQGEDERHEFEAWYVERYKVRTPQRISDKPDSDYWSDGATCAWHGWQGRAAHMMRKLGDGMSIEHDEQFWKLLLQVRYRLGKTQAERSSSENAFVAYINAKLAQARAAGAERAVPEGLPDMLPPMGIRNDRDMLNYLAQAFENEMSVCNRCGHEESTSTCDSAGFLRNYLAAAPSPAGAKESDSTTAVRAVVQEGGEA